MNAVALIVEHDTPDLLALCLASLKRFAPTIRPIVIAGNEGSNAHAAGIEGARRDNLIRDADIVILLDTDVVILSDRWWPWIVGELKLQQAVGGLRHRGDVTQLYCQGYMLLHAHCLAMTDELFERVSSFYAIPPWDTAWQVTVKAGSASTVVVPQVWNGWPARVGVYAPVRGDAPYWAHLGRGTSFRPRGIWREGARRLAARLGSPRARKILSYQRDRMAFLQRGWAIVDPTNGAAMHRRRLVQIAEGQANGLTH